jgi:hypothetical protein
MKQTKLNVPIGNIISCFGCVQRLCPDREYFDAERFWATWRYCVSSRLLILCGFCSESGTQPQRQQGELGFFLNYACIGSNRIETLEEPEKHHNPTREF